MTSLRKKKGSLSKERVDGKFRSNSRGRKKSKWRFDPAVHWRWPVMCLLRIRDKRKKESWGFAALQLANHKSHTMNTPSTVSRSFCRVCQLTVHTVIRSKWNVSVNIIPGAEQHIVSDSLVSGGSRGDNTRLTWLIWSKFISRGFTLNTNPSGTRLAGECRSTPETRRSGSFSLRGGGVEWTGGLDDRVFSCHRLFVFTMAARRSLWGWKVSQEWKVLRLIQGQTTLSLWITKFHPCSAAAAGRPPFQMAMCNILV